MSVSIPTVMRKFTDGQSKVEANGSTLKDVLADLETQHPGITKNVVDGDSLYRFINVFVNDNDARLNGGLTAAVADGATVRILPAVAGGA
jgi:molybdopterin synthase sulfur carrier subunit